MRVSVCPYVAAEALRSNMQVSVIIATYNHFKMLAAHVATPPCWGDPAKITKIIAVADGSTDGTTDLLRGFASHSNLRVIEQQNRGQAAAINAGLRTAKGELVLFLDDDILCAGLRSFLNTLVRCGVSLRVLRSARYSCRPMMEIHSLLTGRVHFAMSFSRRRLPRSRRPAGSSCMASANSSAPRSVILSIGGLDESFSRGNDVEWDFG